MSDDDKVDGWRLWRFVGQFQSVAAPFSAGHAALARCKGTPNRCPPAPLDHVRDSIWLRIAFSRQVGDISLKPEMVF